MKSQARNTEGPRVQEILNLIYELASGNLVARGTVSENNDYLDGIITGINMLADEIAQDITGRKQAEGVLKESEEKFSRAFHSNPHPMSIVTLEEGRYLDVNDSYVQTFGFSREELLGRTTVEMGILKNDRSRRKILQSLKERQTVKNLELELYTRSGRKVDALLSGDKIEIGGQACLLSVLTNITERKQAEEKREQLIQELQETLKEVRTLSGLLPICAWCKKLRDDEGYWKSVEQYIGERTKAEFTHGMCPECQSKFLSERNSNTKVS